MHFINSRWSSFISLDFSHRFLHFLQDILSLEPFLFVGLPAAAVVRLVLRSLPSEGLDFIDVQVTAANRPHNAFADSSWA